MPKGTDGMTDADLAMLTPDERAALDEETSEDELKAQADEASGTMPGEDPPETTETEDEPITPAAAAAPIEGEPPPPIETPPVAEAPKIDALGDPSPLVPRMPVAEGDAPDYTAQLGELSQKFEDGEISTAEYNTQFAALIEARTKASLTAEFNASVDKQLWERDKADLFEKFPDYTKDPVLWGALDASLQAIARDPANAGLNDRQILVKAHEAVQARLGPKATPEPEPKAGPVKPTSRAGQPPDLSLVPKTLAAVPAASEAETGGDKFSAIDRLEGMEFERALARLSDADQAEYAARA